MKLKNHHYINYSDFSNLFDRVILPSIILTQSNKTLMSLNEYIGHIEGFELSILNQFFAIKNSEIKKRSKKITVLFKNAYIDPLVKSLDDSIYYSQTNEVRIQAD